MKRETLRMREIKKNGQLNGFDLSIFQGEIVALTGLADSGYNVIGDILADQLPFDSGHIWIHETLQSGCCIQNPHQHGIYRLYQRSSIIESMTAAENIFLVKPQGQRQPFIDRKTCLLHTNMLLDELGVFMPLSVPAWQLTKVQRRIIELVKLVFAGARLIIIEDTAGIETEDDIHILFSLIRRLTQLDITILVITRRAEEFCQYFDRFIVVRNGINIKCMFPANFNEQHLHNMLLGPAPPVSKATSQISQMGEEVIRIDDLRTNGLSPVSFMGHSGEVIGLLDTQGTRLEVLLQILRGHHPYQGQILFQGEPFFPANRFSLIRSGIGLIDPQAQNFFENLSWPENISLSPHHALKPQHSDLKTIERSFADDFQGVNSKMPLADSMPDEYNRTKLLYLKWSYLNPKLLVCVQPFSSGDIHTRELVAQMIRRLSGQGMCIVLLSTRLHDIYKCCTSLVALEDDPCS